ncbi:tripartite tricarboxylate transporter permease [Aquibacillus salsiterrae]|uniref:Tripartite tricarboxylate transporter permease n=1 Tax=Aquibacillus salsiterrae TaxID=2950439 RepID=A0A9X3WF33_9BACI|nr:tripartite tricarboxylate transporter permease [Aquibacillus salsiterrae]MDC3416254.1 tripartite tricarboxylate transporter permease [Aquibacillus salsiterrae]
MDFFWQAFELYYLLFLFFGLLIGIIVGALPGLTPTMGVALTIPFTFSLGPTEGLIVLGGIYCGSVYGGCVPAILINVPGAPASVATTFDGYPMTENGEGRKALEIATISSVIGGLFGMAMLVFFAPIFADLSLKFGPSQSFWIAIFGLTVIAAISDGSTVKNFIGGSIGILLSFVGINSVTGITRFTLGTDSLIGGFNVVAVLIGLFAFPQALRLIESLTSINKNKPIIYRIKGSSIRESFADVLKKPKSVTIGSVVGGLVGLIPGAGGNIASILSYNEVKRFSKNKENFGKGEKKGVIASESANNAMVGGSLIPLLTLGIPGSPTAAIFLGGLLIHGIWPGRSLFVDNADVAYTFLYSMIGAQILLLFIGLALIKYMTKIAQIPAYFMAPVILSFSVIGAYSMQNNVFDIYTVIGLGLIMFFLQKFNFAAAPIALGFILGPIAEEGLLQGIQVGTSKGSALSYFFSGGINLLFVALIVVTISLSVFQALRGFKWRQPNQVFLTKRLSIGSIFWIALGSLVALVLFYLQGMQLEQRIFPQITLVFLLGLIVIELVHSFGKGNEGISEHIKWSNLPIVLVVVIISSLTSIIGYYTQVLLLMMIVPLYFVYIKQNKDIKIKRIILTSVIFTLVLYCLFTVVFQVPLPLTPVLF